MSLELEQAINVVKDDYIIIPKVRNPATINGNVVLDVTTAIICQEYGFTLEQIKSRSRKGYLPRARYRIFYIARKLYPELPVRNTGRKFGMGENNAHSNVLHGIKQMKGEIETMPKIRQEMELLEKRVREELYK